MSESTPAGWYPDGSGELRYWDGAAWTQHTAPDAAAQPTLATGVAPAADNGNNFAGANYQTGYADNRYPNQGTNVYVGAPVRESNGVGTAGFVLAIVALFVSWIPFAGWVTWVLGLILSFVGVFKQPRGLAIAGLVISLIGVIMLILFATALAGLLWSVTSASVVPII